MMRDLVVWNGPNCRHFSWNLGDQMVPVDAPILVLQSPCLFTLDCHVEVCKKLTWIIKPLCLHPLAIFASTAHEYRKWPKRLGHKKLGQRVAPCHLAGHAGTRLAVCENENDSHKSTTGVGTNDERSDYRIYRKFPFATALCMVRVFYSKIHFIILCRDW